MSEDKIYPSMVIRSQADAIELLEQQIKKQKEAIDKAIEILDNYQNNLYSKSARKFLDDDIERTITILKEVDL